MHLSERFIENVLVLVVSGLILNVLVALAMMLKRVIAESRYGERIGFSAWRAQLARWKERRNAERGRSVHGWPGLYPERFPNGYPWAVPVFVMMALSGYYAARYFNGMDHHAASRMAHQFVRRRYQQEIHALRRVAFSEEAEEQIEDQGSGKFLVRGWYSGESRDGSKKQQNWLCSLQSNDGGKHWNSDRVQKENRDRP